MTFVDVMTVQTEPSSFDLKAGLYKHGFSFFILIYFFFYFIIPESIATVLQMDNLANKINQNVACGKTNKQKGIWS